jgi:hypothetical protein
MMVIESHDGEVFDQTLLVYHRKETRKPQYPENNPALVHHGWYRRKGGTLVS